MPTVVSTLVRAAHDASAVSRAARSAVAAATRAARSAAVAATCEARAAAARAAAARSSAKGTAAAAADQTHAFRSGLGCHAPSKHQFRGGAREAAPRDSGVSFSGDGPRTPPVKAKAKFVVEEKDLESDEALWRLYERWCKHYNLERDPDEMARRFNKFKEKVLFVHQENNSNLPYKLGLNQFTDGKLAETYLHGVLAANELASFFSSGSRFCLEGDSLRKIS